jgi:hypothetical protein
MPWSATSPRANSKLVQNGKEFVAKKDHVWTCAKGTTEGATNEGTTVAIMRITDLLEP